MVNFKNIKRDKPFEYKNEEIITELLDEDEISPEEAGFMQGYYEQ